MVGFLLVVSRHKKEEVIAHLKETDTEVLINYLPVALQKATEFYAQCALETGIAFVNNISVFIASDPVWAKRITSKPLMIFLLR